MLPRITHQVHRVHPVPACASGKAARKATIAYWHEEDLHTMADNIEETENATDTANTGQSKRKVLMIIDGNAMIHRAFHAIPEELTTRSGEPVNATYGFTTMLLKALNDIQPDYIAMTFDRPTPTFRHQQYVQYKAHRPTLPDNMRPQFGRIRQVVQAFGIPIYEKDGFEADDVLGTLSVQAAQQGIDTVILTGDMDTLQLVNKHVMVMAAKRGITDVTEYDVPAVEARYGLPPKKLPDFKGLVGDKSDNIPGVPGIGEKTATKLINEFGDLEGILAHIDQLSPKEQRLLRDMADQARESKFLATIVLDVPVQLDLEACRKGQIHRDDLLAIFRELEFRTLVDKIPGSPTSKEAIPSDALDASGISSTSRPRRAEPTPIPAQEEDLLLAPPVGAVPIMSPPPPPAGMAFAAFSNEEHHETEQDGVTRTATQVPP